MGATRVVIVGGGIIGLATAMAISQAEPGVVLTVIEKEATWASHQSGHNSGVIHSGIYYRPGTLRARLCAAGNASMVDFCRRHGIDHAVCGKLIVAADRDECARLEALYQRGVANGLAVERLGPDGIRDREPHVAGVEALFVPSTAIVDFRRVCAAMATQLEAAGADLRLGTTVVGAERRDGTTVVETTAGPLTADRVVTCAGLHSDRLAARCGATVDARIVPFRGEYFELIPSRRHLVNGLVYPVPDPALPFLGVHFSRGIDGSVHAGPNAVVGLAREGYRRTDVNFRDAADVATYPGFWRLAARHRRAAWQETARSLSKAAFVRSLRRLVPEIAADDLVPAGAGVRAQAVTPAGELVDDFVFVESPGAVHVCNAPSPAATASLEIGKVIAARLASVAA